MSWEKHYQPPDAKFWQGRADTPPNSCFFQIIQCVDLTKASLAHPQTFALLGFRCDQGIRRNLGRIGAEEGPVAIRETLAKLYIPPKKFVCLDVGDITCTDGDLEGAQQALGEAVSLLLKNQITPIVIGGGHELAWGHYQGILKKFPHEALGIVNFDAHFDMRPLLANNLGSSGTPFLQIAQEEQRTQRQLDYNCIGIQSAGNIQALFETADKYQVSTILADEIHQGQLAKCFGLIDRVISQNHIIYLSLCLDVFAAAYAPGVSAPQSL